MKPARNKLLPRLFISILVLVFFAILISLGISRETPVGSIMGEVYDIKTGNPIEGAKVYHPTRDTYVKTDVKGKYELLGVPQKKKGYTIRAQAKGFVYSTYSDVKVKEGKPTENINFKMVRRESFFRIYTFQKVFAPDEKPTINIRGYLVKKIKLKVYKIDPVKYIDYITEYGKMSEINTEDMTPISEASYVSHFDEEGEFQDTYTIPTKVNGVYVIKAEAVGGNLAKTTWLIKSDIALIVKRSPKELLVYAQSFSSGKPIPGVKLRLYQDKVRVGTGSTDKNGLYQFRGYSPKPYKIIAQKAGSFAFARTYYGSVSEKQKTYLYTDRPVYRPGQEVFFKGITRRKTGFKYAVNDNMPVDVTISNSRGNKIYNRRLYTNSYGTFNSSLKLEEEPPLGSYTLRTYIGGNDTYYRFEVSEYKKPEYKIEVSTGKPHYVAGDKIRVKVKGKYYFGAPVANAKFDLTVMESAYRWSRVGWDDYYSGRHDFHGGIMFETSGKLDAKGEAEVVIPTGKIKHNKQLKIEAEVTDISGRAVTGDATVPLSVGEFALYCHTKKYVYEPDEEIPLEIEAMDFKEKPVKDQAVSVKISRITYEEVKEKKTYSRGGRRAEGYEYHTKRVETQVGGIIKKTTDKHGKAEVIFKPGKEGSYDIDVFSVDSRGNKITYAYYMYVASESYSGMMGEADLQIITDKKKYHRGDTVKAVITTSQKGIYALLTIEGMRIYEKKVIYIKGGSKTLDIPLKKEYFPNVFLSVSAIKDMDLIKTSKNIQMFRYEKKLNVTIKPDKKRYHPADPAHYTVEIKDHEGNPVEAELSLGVVDEAIYAIKPDTTPNIHAFFWRYDYNRVDTNFSFSRDYSGGADKDRPDRIRKDFKDTAFWDPVVRTGKDGRAKVEFKMPDNLTTWVTTVRAATLNTDVGSAFNFVISTKDLLVRLETPRFLTQKDKIYIGGVVHNYTKKTQKIKVWLEVEGVELAETGKKLATLAPEEAKDFYWLVHAKEPGEAKFTLLCMGTDANDAMQLSLPILPFGVEEVRAQSGVIGKNVKGAQVELELPKDAIPKATRMEILLSPSIAGTMLENLDYLITYPYGCVEQTMSSFLPALTAKRVFSRLGIKDFVLEKKVPVIVRKGLTKLYEMQHSDGGWGWWKNDKTHPYMTAYVVRGLKSAQRTGFAINRYSLKQGINALINMTGKKPAPVKTLGGTVQQGEEWNSRAYVLYSLWKVGSVHRKKVNEVYENRKALNDYGLALLAMTLDGIGESGKVNEVMSEIDKRAKDSKNECYWDGRTFTYSWIDNNIETTAYCLQAYVQIRPNDARIQRIINWLSKHRRGKGYHSTKDTAAVVYAFTNYLLKSGEMKPDYVLNLVMNGKTLIDYNVKSIELPQSVGSIKLDKNEVKSGKNTININKDGEGVLYYTVRLRYFPSRDKIESYSNGIKVSRRYMLITRRKDKDGKIVEVAEPLPERPLERGAHLRVEVTIEADKDYRYVIIEDPLPAGFEVTIPQGDRNWGSMWWCRQEVRDEKVSFFSIKLNEGKKMRLTYDIRSEMFGKVNILPATAYAMYEPEIRGHSSNDILFVKMEKNP